MSKSIDNFRGILVLSAKDKRPPSRTLADLREAGYIVLFLDSPVNYRVENHTQIPLEGNAKLLLQTFYEASGSDYKSNILQAFGRSIATLLSNAEKPA